MDVANKRCTNHVGCSMRPSYVDAVTGSKGSKSSPECCTGSHRKFLIAICCIGRLHCLYLGAVTSSGYKPASSCSVASRILGSSSAAQGLKTNCLLFYKKSQQYVCEGRQGHRCRCFQHEGYQTAYPQREGRNAEP